MDGRKDKRTVLESYKNISSGYSIEMGNTTYGSTLEERIQAARAASSTAKQSQKQNINEKLCLTNSPKMAIKRTSTLELKKKSRQHCSSSFKTDFQLANVSSINSISVENINSNLRAKCNTNCLLKPTYKGGGYMQRRLEAIKAKNVSNLNSLECNNLGSVKFSNSPTKNLSLQGTLTKKTRASNQLNINVSKHNEYKTRSVQKNPSSETEHSTFFGHCDRNKNVTSTSNSINTLATSVQNRLVRAKEEMKNTKSKFLNQNDISKIEIVKNPSTTEYSINTLATSVQNRLLRAKEEMKNAKSKFLSQNDDSKIKIVKNRSTIESGSIHQGTYALVHNVKNKTKRLNHSSQSIKKKIPAIIATAQKHNLNVNTIINKQLITVQQKPSVVPNSMKSSNPSETVVSKKLENRDIHKELNQKELDSFSFVLPQTSVQQRLENNKKIQVNNDDSMEWEVIIEPDNIVDKVNDLRRTTCEYEPMEWTPDSITHSDQINHCLVIDTNILLSDLNSVTIVIDKCLPEYGYLTIVLPWQVLQELDCLKKGDNALGYRAREATRWLLKMFSKSHPRLKGQPMTKKDVKNPDDAILKCAIIIKERVNYVSLVTDDKILSIKSEVNGIPVKNSTWLQNLVSVKNQKESGIFQEAVKKYPVFEDEVIKKFESRLEHIIARVLKFAVGCKMDCATFTKQVWWKIYSLTPPLNLTKCLLKLNEHWNIIAPHQLFKAPQKQLNNLVCFFKDLQQISSGISLSWNELYSLLKDSSEIINALPYEYYHITDALLNDLMKARRILKQKLDCTINDESLSISLLNDLNISNGSNASSIDNILLNILKEVDTFRSYIYKAHGLKCSSSSENEVNYKDPKTICFKEKLEDFCHKLSNIIKVMTKIKKLGSEQILGSSILVDTFSKAIIEFDNGLIQLDKERVTDYCLMRDKNSFLSILISFQNNLAAMKNLVTAVKN